MRKHNGKQLYGIRKIIATLKMARNNELKKLSLKQKLALNYVSKESKLFLPKMKAVNFVYRHE